jgi:hypothetical protein
MSQVLFDSQMEREQRELAGYNATRIAPRLPADVDDVAELARALRQRHLELAAVDRWRADVAPRAAEAPGTGEAFVRWFAELREAGPGQHDPLFPWLAEHASLEDLRWFLTQEVAGEAGFDDLVALAQLGMPARAKLEMARNYWDEMGQGHAEGMHGPMLARLADALDLPRAGEVVVEALELSNLMLALAHHRQYAFQAVGALGVIELTAPGRAARVNAALKRLGIGGEARRYFALHATLDVKHSEAWNREVLVPLVDRDPRVTQALAEGALMRLQAGARCFARYRRALGVRAQEAA